MKLIIDIDKDIAQGIIDGEGEKPRNIVRSFQATIADAIKNGTPLEDIRTDVHRHKMDFYPSDYTLINTLIDKWINRGVDV